MKSLSKTDDKQRQTIIDEMEKAKEELDASIVDFNAAQEAAFVRVQSALDILNGVVAAAEAFRADIHSQMDNYFGEKSEKWQEGEAGENYQTFMDEWEEEISEVEIDHPDELESPECECVDAFRDLPTEAS